MKFKIPELFKQKTKAGFSPNWSVRFTDQTGKRRTLSLRTPDKALAEKRAEKAIEADLSGKTHILDEARGKASTSTVGELIDAYLPAKLGKPNQATRRENQAHLLLMLTECGHKNPRKVRLSELDDKLVKQFFRNRLAPHDEASVDFDKVRTTANSVYRKTKSIFSRKVLASGTYDYLKLPALDKFMNVPFLDQPDHQYSFLSNELFTKLINDSVRLRTENTSLYCAFLICYTLGLRKKEAFHARWDWVSIDKEGRFFLKVPGRENWKGKVFRTKSGKGREIEMAKRVYDELQALSPIGNHPEYLIPTKTDWERRVKVWREFGPWFRENGIFRNKSAHECRKFFGAQVATHDGIYVASKLLGHSTVTVTEKSYADLVERPGLPTILLPPFEPNIEEVDGLPAEESPCSPSAGQK